MAPNLKEYMNMLNLSQDETAACLSVTPRTIRRWEANPTEISGAALQALHAWVRLERLGVPWRPNEISVYLEGTNVVEGSEQINEDIKNQIALHRENSVAVDSILEKVGERGGPTLPWKVDIERGKAILTIEGKTIIEVHFYRLINGGFSLGTYSRRDVLQPDLKRDQPLIEDAIYSFAKAFRKN